MRLVNHVLSLFVEKALHVISQIRQNSQLLRLAAMILSLKIAITRAGALQQT